MAEKTSIAYLLHSRTFKDSSLIVECFTQEYGVISLVAKGAKRMRSKFLGILQPFILMEVAFLGKSELKTLTRVEAQCLLPHLMGTKVMLGLYINELMCRLLQKHDPHPQLFQTYHQVLLALKGASDKPHQENILRHFELNLLSEMGYGLTFAEQQAETIYPDELYLYEPNSGIIKRDNGDSRRGVSGETIRKLMEMSELTPHQLQEAKYLMRQILAVHLGDKPLASRKLFTGVING